MSEILDELFIKYNSDKSSLHHGYSSIYNKLLTDPNRTMRMLILGIGGYQYTDRGGGDLKAFYDYLPNARIDGADLYDKSFLNNDRINTHICSQTDEEGLLNILRGDYPPSIIIDDASHQCPLTIKSFEILFPKLCCGGMYIIEDVHSSYWDEIAVDGTNFGGGDHPNTTINYFKYLLDRNLNREDSEGRIYNRGIVSEQFDIESITFYRKMICIRKK